MVQPVFIAGCPRSGTTLVNFILNKNKECFLLNEKGIYAGLYRDYHYRRANGSCPEEAFRACMIQVVQAHDECTLMTEDQIDEVLRRSALVWDAMLGSFMENLIDRHRPSAHVWGDKTPGATFYLDTILENHPGAKIVYVRRHPMHVVESLSREKFPHASNHPLINSFVVRTYVNAFESKRSSIPDRQLFEVQYEELLQDPKRVVSGLCQFIGIEYRDDMLREADDEVRTLFGWPENKAWGPIRPQESSRKASQNAFVVSYLREVMEQYRYHSEEASSSLWGRWGAKTLLLPFRVLNEVYNAVRGLKYPVYREEVLQAWPSTQRLRSWTFS